MSSQAYATSVVTQLMRPRVKPEIWEGALAKWLRLLVTFLPLQLLVSGSFAALTPVVLLLSDWGSEIELDPLPTLQA
ncbi:hypothetical protein BDW67DRAFT_161412 [Aspergillus spinulosporus]